MNVFIFDRVKLYVFSVLNPMAMMLRLLLLSLLCMLVCKPVAAQQNLVPNPSFEDYIGCPTGYPDLDGKCAIWKSFRNSPDYINNCSLVCGYENQFGFQLPRTGQAYTGFANYQNTVPNSTEQMGVELLSPLEIGVKYYVSFYVSLAYNRLLTNVATNKIGALFTTFSYQDDDPFNPTFVPQFNKAQIYTDETIVDTVNWTKIAGSFTADSSYSFIVIGGFFNDSLKNKIFLPFEIAPFGSYYFVDDVCVSKDADLCDVPLVQSCSVNLPTAFTPNGDGKNDEYRLVQNCGSLQEFTMRIYNRWGELVFSTNDIQTGWDGKMNGIDQPSGIYFVYVSLISEATSHSKSSSITLLR